MCSGPSRRWARHGAVRADRRRACGLPRAAARQGQAVLPYPLGDRVDDARADVGADGGSERELVGASPFPRHWIYDHDGGSSQKSGVVDFKTWYRESHGEQHAMGRRGIGGVVTQAETELEREISRSRSCGCGSRQAADARARARRSSTRATRATTLYLLLDGVLTVEVDGEEVAEIGPGAMVGERAVLEGGSARRRCARSRLFVSS